MIKNKKLVTISVVLIALVVATSALVYGTLAKYVSKSSGSDFASVAKWGVTLEPVTQASGPYGDTGFATTYNVKVNDDEIQYSVNGGYNDVVAPGTSGRWDGIAFYMRNSQVAVQLTTEAEVTLTGWEINGDFYCPLVFFDDIKGLDYDNAEDLEEAIEEAINEAGTHKHNPGTFSPVYGNGQWSGAGAFSWSWPFENGTDSEGVVKQTDVKDTKLAQLDPAPTIEFTMNITATQID